MTVFLLASRFRTIQVDLEAICMQAFGAWLVPSAPWAWWLSQIYESSFGRVWNHGAHNISQSHATTSSLNGPFLNLVQIFGRCDPDGGRFFFFLVFFFHHQFRSDLLRYGGASNEIAMFGFGLSTFATGPGFPGWGSYWKDWCWDYVTIYIYRYTVYTPI